MLHDRRAIARGLPDGLLPGQGSPAAWRRRRRTVPLAARLSGGDTARPSAPAFAKDLIPLAFSPALYIYARSLIPGGRRNGPGRFLHFLPFTLAVAILASPLVTIEPTGALATERGGSVLAVDQAFSKPLFISGVQLAVPASFVAYALLMFGLLRKHRERSKDYFSFESSVVDLSWLGVLVVSFAVVFAYMLSATVLAFVGVRHPLLNPIASMDIGYGSFIAVFGYFALRQERAFYRYGYLDGREDDDSPTTSGADRSPNVEPKYSKSALDDYSLDRYFTKIEKELVERCLYRRSDLTMDDLAKRTGISRTIYPRPSTERRGGISTATSTPCG